MLLPQIEYTANTATVVVGGLTVYFSYTTPIGFYHKSTGRVISKNDWSKTTGKFINSLEPDKKLQVDREVMEEKLRGVLALGE